MWSSNSMTVPLRTPAICPDMSPLRARYTLQGPGGRDGKTVELNVTLDEYKDTTQVASVQSSSSGKKEPAKADSHQRRTAWADASSSDRQGT